MRSGGGDLIKLVGETEGDPATVVARLSGGGTVRSGVADGDTPADVLVDRFREADRSGSRPRPRVADTMGVLTPVDAGEPRLAVLPGMTGKLPLRSGRGAAAMPSQIISSMGCVTRTTSTGPKRAMHEAMMLCSKSMIAFATSAAVAGRMGAKG